MRNMLYQKKNFFEGQLKRTFIKSNGTEINLKLGTILKNNLKFEDEI